MAKTAGQFDKWMEKKRQRPIGICGECGREKELRQREPEPLCGACLEKLRRAEIRENDPAASRKDAKKREKRIRSEMNKVLNAVDALDGLIPDEHLNLLSGIAKMHLKPIVEGPDADGHGHDETERDRDVEPPAKGSGELGDVAQQPSPAAAMDSLVPAETEMERYAKSIAKDGKVYRRTPMSAEALKGSAAKQEKSLSNPVNEPVAPSYGPWKNSGVFSPDEGYTFRTSESPSNAVNSSLSDILETDRPEKCYLTAKCCAGILRRAASGKRRRKLSPELEKALKAVVARGDKTVVSSECDESKQKEVFQPAKARTKLKKPVYPEGVDYAPAFLGPGEADELLELMKSQPFADCRVSYGPQVFPPPRKSNAWKDRYALATNPQPEPSAIRSLRQRLSERYGVPFNSVQCNWHGGTSEVKAHYDPYRIVAMIRLGATRTFEVGEQRRNGGGNFKPYPMPHGSLITFLSGGLAHRMSPDPAAGDCVSLVFRLVTTPQTVASWHDKPTYGKTRAAHKKLYDTAVSEYRSAN